MYRLFVALCFAVVSLPCFSQSNVPEKKLFDHYLGFQANELMRQILNLSNNTTAVSNPYLLTYSLVHSSTRWGINAGLGYNYQKVLTKISPVNRETKNNSLSYRIGVEKKFSLGKRFEASVALDMISGYRMEKTFSSSVVNQGSVIDSSNSVVSAKVTSIGGGPHLSLSYAISQYILLGTETTMYYALEKQRQNFFVTNIRTDLFSGEQSTIISNDNSETDVTGFNFTIPVALFLIVKF